MRLGLAIPHYDTSLAGAPASWDGIKRVARLAERCGWSSVWISDHLFLDWGKYGGSPDIRGSYECWTTMSAIAASTRTIRIGSLALCNDLRAPGLVAKMAASLDVLSGGRLDLGLGAGWYEPEYRAGGFVFRRPSERIDRLREAAGIIGRLLEGDEVTFAGKHYSLDGAVCRPLPLQSPRPPVWIGGKGNYLLRAAVAAADGWNWSWLGDIETYEQRLGAARSECERAGRDFGTLRRSVGAYLCAGTDDRDARRRFEILAARTPAGVLAGDSATGVSWEEFRKDRVAGTVSEVIDRLGALSDLGVEEVIVTLGALPFQLADEEQVELVGREVAAALR